MVKLLELFRGWKKLGGSNGELLEKKVKEKGKERER